MRVSIGRDANGNPVYARGGKNSETSATGSGAQTQTAPGSGAGEHQITVSLE